MYVANDGSYIIKDQSISIATDVYGEPAVTYPTNCFECDDLIAPVVAELICKGYTTKYCCQGHMSPNSIVDTDTINNTDIPELSNFNTFNSPVYYYPYIMFDKKITKKMLGKLPLHWRFRNGKTHGCLTIEANMDTNYTIIDSGHNEYYDYYSRVVDYCKELYDWASGLPYID